jgi:hypothetical protein
METTREKTPEHAVGCIIDPIRVAKCKSLIEYFEAGRRRGIWL